MKNNKNNKAVSSELEIGNLFKIILIILIVFGIFYVLTYYMQKNKKTLTTPNSDNSVAIIQYDEILIGNILNQSETDYYVLILKKEDYDKRYKDYLNNYTNNNKFYYSFIDNGLNRNYVSENSNLNVESINDLKVSGTTLLKISSGKIVESYDGNDSVMQKFIDINK